MDESGSNNTLLVLKKLLRKLGPEQTIILSNLIDKSKKTKEANPNSDGWFFYPNRMLCIDCCISEAKLIKLKKELGRRGLFISELRGGPPKEFYKIDYFVIEKIMENEQCDFNTVPNTYFTNPLQPNSDLKVPNNISIPKGIDNSLREFKPEKKGEIEAKASIGGNVVASCKFSSVKWVSDVIELWNSMPGPSKHLKPKTKTLQNAEKLLTQLTEATFFSQNTITDKFCKTHSIPRDRWIIKKLKFTPNQILDVVARYELCWRADRWPHDKKYLPKSLEGFLHNPIAGSSWFLALHFHPQLSDPISTRYISKYSQSLKWYLQSESSGDIHRMVDGLEYWVRDNFDLSNRRIQHHLMTSSASPNKPLFAPFFEKYSSWLKKEALSAWKKDWLLKNPEEIFKPWGAVFKEFLSYLKEKLSLSVK